METFSDIDSADELRNHPIESLYGIYKKSEESRWIISPKDALLIFDLVRRFKPKYVLELGSGIGCSTAVMARAMDGEGYIVSLDQSEKCVRIARELIPEALRKIVMFQYARPEVFQFEIFDPWQFWMGYRRTALYSQASWDMVIIDGPGPFLARCQTAQKTNTHFVSLPAGDLLYLLPSLGPGSVIFIDGRKSSVSLYKRYLLHYLDILEENEHYFLARRTNYDISSEEEENFSKGEKGPPQIKTVDYLYLSYLRQGYFKSWE